MALLHHDWRNAAGQPKALTCQGQLVFVRPFVQYGVHHHGFWLGWVGWQRMIELCFVGDVLDTISKPTRMQKRASRRVAWLGRQCET